MNETFLYKDIIINYSIISFYTQGGCILNRSYLASYLDDSNMALGMSIINAAWGTGMVIGPSISGIILFT